MRMFDKNPFSSWMLKRDNQSNKAPLFFGTPLDSQTQKRPESMSWLGLQGHALTGGPSFCWFSGCILESWITTHGGKSLKGTRYTEQPLFQQNRLGEHMICNQFIKMYDNLVCLIWFKSPRLTCWFQMVHILWLYIVYYCWCKKSCTSSSWFTPLFTGFIHPRWLAGQTPAEFALPITCILDIKPPSILWQRFLRSPHSTPHLTLNDITNVLWSLHFCWNPVSWQPLMTL